jgi:hypothetical protein
MTDSGVEAISGLIALGKRAANPQKPLASKEQEKVELELRHNLSYDI